MIEYSPEEMRKINFKFPNLYYDDGKIKGEIDFKAKYVLARKKKGQTEKWMICDCEDGEECIIDAYDIAIHLDTSYPRVFETAQRIRNLANERKLGLADVHLFPKDGSCCLGLFLENPNETLSSFVVHKVYPYFVWQAYFEKYNKIPPCGEYSHGETGRREFEIDLMSVSRNQPCPCGSGKKLKHCCIQTLSQSRNNRTNCTRNLIASQNVRSKFG